MLWSPATIQQTPALGALSGVRHRRGKTQKSNVAMRKVETVFYECVSSPRVATNLPNRATVLNSDANRPD